MTNLAITRPSANAKAIQAEKKEQIIQSMPATPFLSEVMVVNDGSNEEKFLHSVNFNLLK